VEIFNVGASMTKKFCYLNSALLLGMLCAGSSYAAPYYVSLGAGAARLKDFCSNAASGYDCKSIAPAFELDAGYQLGDYAGVELGYFNPGTAQTKGPLYGPTLEVKQQMSGGKLAATLTLPLSASLSLTGKLGGAYIYTELTASNSSGAAIAPYSAANISPLYGVGLQYSVSETWAVHAQYDYIAKVGDNTMGTDSLAMFTLGVSYHFADGKKYRSTNKSLQIDQAEQAPPVRVTILLQHPATHNKAQLETAIADTCLCQPSFVRLNSMSAIVYQIRLAPGQDFNSFKQALLATHSELGLKDLQQNM
jgi:opacity protein-like surface antigen